ncbi:hypothetical protein ACC687_37965, partial [Rhizobium ruizarguesonis]
MLLEHILALEHAPERAACGKAVFLAFVKRGLFDDISDIFEKEKYKDVLGATAGAVTDEGKKY